MSNALRALAIVGPPVTIATALLFYFGWAVTAAQSRAMGVDESIFAMSTRDYVVRSLPALFLPLIVGSGVLLSWVVLHGKLVDLSDRSHGGESVFRFGRILAWTAWWVLPVVGAVVARVQPAWGELVMPLSLALGFLLAEYGVRLMALGTTDHQRHRPPWVSSFRSVLIGVLVTAALFWEVANFAGVVGRGKAELVAGSTNQYPSVTIYSQVDLRLRYATSPVPEGGPGDYRYVYSGLHLLQRTGGRFFLVPTNWTPGREPMIVLRDEDSVRLEFTGSGRDFGQL